MFSISILGSAILCNNSCLDLPTDLVQLRAMRLLTVREPAHHFMVEPRYDVDVHVEHFLGSSLAI
jgi:hypothetical protein